MKELVSLGVVSAEFAIGPAIGYLFFALLKDAKDNFSKEANQWLSERLMGLREIETAKPNHDWPSFFIGSFDHIFGSRSLTWRRVYMSCLFSLLCFLLVAVLWLVMNLPDVDPLEIFWKSGIPQFPVLSALTILIFPISNLVPDFISLMESRQVIGWIALKPTWSRITLGILFDFVFTSSIYILLFITLVFLFVFLYLYFTSW